MPRKNYKLFGKVVWSIEVYDDPQEEAEDEEVIEKDIGSTTVMSAGDQPAFGFTPWTPEPWSDDWED